MPTIISRNPLIVLGQLYALTKPRVLQLIVFCALIGMVMAVPRTPTLTEIQHAILACLGIWFGCTVFLDQPFNHVAYLGYFFGVRGYLHCYLEAIDAAKHSDWRLVWCNASCAWMGCHDGSGGSRSSSTLSHYFLVDSTSFLGFSTLQS